MTGVNTNYEEIAFDTIFEGTYGNNSNSSNLMAAITSDNYNVSGVDRGECVSVTFGSDMSLNKTR